MDMTTITNTTSVTERFIDAARTDLANLSADRDRLQEHYDGLLRELNKTQLELNEIVSLQNVALARLTQLEKAKING